MRCLINSSIALFRWLQTIDTAETIMLYCDKAAHLANKLRPQFNVFVHSLFNFV